MKKRPIRIDGDIAFVPLTNGYEAIIDAEDVELADINSWQSLTDYRGDGSIRAIYARNGRKYLHRVIMQSPYGYQVDHINGNGLDCRKSNMRIANNMENGFNQKTPCNNTSKVKGVNWRKSHSKWEARIMVDGKRKNLGLFDNIKDAAASYAKASALYHGEFGRLG